MVVRLVVLAVLLGVLLPPYVAHAQSAPCDVQSMTRITDGGDQDWLHSNGQVVGDREESGTYQLHRSRDNAQGDLCLSCLRWFGAPSRGHHILNPTWHPSGSYIVVQGEMEQNPLHWLRGGIWSELYVNGLWTNLYAVTPNGFTWTRLTDYDSSKTDGALGPHFSPDGSQLLWSRIVENAGAGQPWGRYRLMLADFIAPARATPRLTNIQDITPQGEVFVESQGWTPDGRVVFTSDHGSNGEMWRTTIYTMDLRTRTPEPVVTEPYWNEHPSYSPSGQQMVYMSNEPYAWLGVLGAGLTELYRIDVATGERVQLTHMNDVFHPQYVAGGHIPARSSWNADGSQLLITVQSRPEYPRRSLWLLQFAGSCGGAS